jgi:hypothetical protein
LCYPNPSSGEIHLSFNDDTIGSTEIAMYDLMGRKVFAAPCLLTEGRDEVTINPKLSPGVYLLKVGNYSQKIVRF